MVKNRDHFCIFILVIFINIFINKESFCREGFLQNNSNLFASALVSPKIKKHTDFHCKTKKSFLSERDSYINAENKFYKSKTSYYAQKISFEKFKRILITESFPESSIEKMWCIAQNESSLNPLAYNYNKNGSFDVGLFQINQIWKRWCGMKDKDLLQINHNARCALLVFKKQGYSAWVTFRNFCS